jgi:hypothetical protein
MAGASGVSWAQVTSATLSGIVMDNTDAVVPGAQVTLINEQTNAASQAVTNDIGEFVFTFLRPGTYTVRVEKASFKILQSTQLELGAAQQVRRRFVLEVGQVTEGVTVSAEATMVNTVSAEQREALVRRQFTDLPIARRNFSGILSQATGLVDAGSGKYNLNGLGAAGARVSVDGTEASADARTSGTAFQFGWNKIDLLSLESISEVQVIKGVVPAEYGQALSGNVNVITNSGTNQYHGSVFYNYQGAGLGARHQMTTSKPNFVWNQFGGSMGGPIIRDRLFFFAAYEGYRESSFSFLSGDVPTQLLRQQMLSAWRFPETQPLLDQLPLPNLPHGPAAIVGRWEGASSKTSSDNHMDVKGDWRVGEAGNLSATYTRGRPNAFEPRVSPANPRTYAGRQDRITSAFTRGAARWTSETRFGFNYNVVNRQDHAYDILDPVKKETIEGQRRLPSIQCQACPFSSPNGESRPEDPKPFYSFEEKIAYIAGRHTLKFGGMASIRGSGRFNVNNAAVRYATVQDMLANRPNQVTTTFGTPSFVGRDYSIGFFAQDDWRMSSKLVLNLGLRYDYFSNYSAKGKDQNDPYLAAGFYNPDGVLDDQFRIGPVRDPNNPIDPDPVNFGPRFGFSYNPDGKGRTTIRGGYGIMFKQVPIAYFLLSVGRSPIFPFRTIWSQAEAQRYGMAFPVYNEDVFPILQKLGQVRIENVFNPQLNNPYGQNLYLGVQRTIGSGMVFETALVSTKGIKFIMEREANQVDRLTGERPSPDVGGFTYVDNSQRTFHWSSQSSLRKRFSRGLLFNLHYTFGKTLAHAGGDTATADDGEMRTVNQDYFCVSCDWGPATSDIRHNFAANWLYEAPALRGSDNPVLKHALGGWQISGTMLAVTGRPFNVAQSNALPNQRPDITTVEKATNDCCSFGNLQYLNRSAFINVPIIKASGATARPGSLPNNALRGPGSWTVNAGLGRNFKIKESMRLQVRADLLNAFNHTNYTSMQTNLDSSTFGRITNTAGARVIQINGRLSF